MRDYQVIRTVGREKLTAMLYAALESGEYRFARQASLAWLAAFQGDLEVVLLQGQAMIADGKTRQGIAEFETVSRKDPFNIEAYRLMASASKESDRALLLFSSTCLYVLGSPLSGQPLAEWGEPLRHALLAFQAGQPEKARSYLEIVRRIQPGLLLADVLDLLVLRSEKDLAAVADEAERCHQSWPDCQYASLILAETSLQKGREQEAVQLLHLCAANDAMGLVARRLWGSEHPYRSLWPEEMVIVFDLPIPSGVAGSMGWNRLEPGELRAEMVVPLEDLDGADVFDHRAEQGDPSSQKTIQDDEDEEIGSLQWLEGIARETGDGEAQAVGEAPTEAVGASPTEGQQEQPVTGADEAPQVVSTPIETPSRHNGRHKRSHKADIEGTTQSVSGELERLAKKLKQPNISRVDGRFPIYVILSSMHGLSEQFGPQTTSVLQNELKKLAAAVGHRPGWNSILYFPDDFACVTQYGLTPIDVHDPWKVKNALSDLDVALRQRGEMIGALLIVGGDEVVPFHRLPNPTDDMDGEVLSDSPYATLDANYFVPEWPVGRLPGEKGPDAGLLLDQLHSMQRYHGRRRRNQSLFSADWLRWVGVLMQRFVPSRTATSFGYTAAVWRRSSLAVFRPIGAPHTVKASPPEDSASVDRQQITYSSLGYYNLHGLEDSPAWYGQRDPMEANNGPDYPVALSPDDLKRNGRSPRVIYSEACFGAHILHKGEKDSLALKFLSMGSMAVVGSTCTAYGSLNTPLIAADLLGNLFWQHLKSGRTAGEALMQAKIDLVREMNKRQGFLDGEDQKTLISFVLYGDPMAAYDGFRVQNKVYRMKIHPNVMTVSDKPDESIPGNQVSGEVLNQVKSIVADYLPGAGLSEMRFTRQTAPAQVKGINDVNRKKVVPGEGKRIVVTVSKRVKAPDYTHLHTMRVTLDETGKAVKLSISR